MYVCMYVCMYVYMCSLDLLNYHYVFFSCIEMTHNENRTAWWKEGLIGEHALLVCVVALGCQAWWREGLIGEHALLVCVVALSCQAWWREGLIGEHALLCWFVLLPWVVRPGGRRGSLVSKL